MELHNHALDNPNPSTANVEITFESFFDVVHETALHVRCGVFSFLQIFGSIVHRFQVPRSSECTWEKMLDNETWYEDFSEE